MNFVFVILNFVLLCCVRSDDERTLSMQLNPGCSTQLDSTQCEESITFVHIQAESSDNTLHYLWDFTGIPSLMLARTDPNTSLIIDWNNFITGRPGSVVLSSDPSFVFASVIHQFLIFDDAGDKADVNDDKIGEVKQFNPYFFNWSRENLTQANDEVTMSMRAIIDNGDESNGSFVLKLSAFGSTKHGSELPHLYHSSHSMQLDIVAENIKSNFTNPRVALTYLLVSSENKTEGSFKLNKRRNLDDEFTPGVFDVFDIVSPRSKNVSQGAFVQYRPICYTLPERTVSGSTELKQGDIKNFLDTDKEMKNFENTLPFSFYGYRLGTKVVQGTNITFGASGDGFYSRSNFTSFSMLLGIGAPPIERLSAFVITFAAIGLGVPLLVLLIGGTTVIIKRYRN